jgi:hypothetical protein
MGEFPECPFFSENVPWVFEKKLGHFFDSGCFLLLLIFNGL